MTELTSIKKLDLNGKKWSPHSKVAVDQKLEEMSAWTEEKPAWPPYSASHSYDLGAAEKRAGVRSTSSKNVRKTPITIQWKSISVTTNEGKSILNGISGMACGGELMAIMGPSGAGKSTLMNVLTGFTQKRTSGQILVNGANRDMRSFRKVSSYVMQDDLLLPHLTVRESVYLALCFKIASCISKEDINKRVDECLCSLGLTECQNVRANNLSGGQRKRLSIAQDIVSNPPVIFLDEPTSGLDSSSCFQCVQLLKSYVEKGRTVVCSIHQPSARVLELFDKLYILADGNCIYRGPTKNLVSFLEEQGLNCPQYHNPTDFVMEVATMKHGDCIWKLKNAVDCMNRLDEKSPVFQLPTLRNQQGSVLQALQHCRLQEHVDKQLPPLEKTFLLSNDNGCKVNVFRQFRFLMYRSLICTLREPMATQLRFLSHVTVGLLVGTLYFGVGNKASNIQENITFLFFNLLFLIFTAMMPGILTFPMEKMILSRHQLNNWYSTKMYYLARTIVEIPFQIIFPTVFCSIVYWMTAQPNDLFRFGIFTLSSIMTSLLAESASLFLGAATSVQNAVFLAPVISVPVFLFCGFFVHLNTINPYLRWLSYISYVRYGFECLLLGTYSFDRPELECEDLHCLFKEPVDILKQMHMADGNLYVNYSAFWAMFVVVRLMAYYMLWYKVVYRR